MRSLNKFMAFENRDPFQAKQVQNIGLVESSSCAKCSVVFVNSSFLELHQLPGTDGESWQHRVAQVVRRPIPQAVWVITDLHSVEIVDATPGWPWRKVKTWMMEEIDSFQMARGPCLEGGFMTGKQGTKLITELWPSWKPWEAFRVVYKSCGMVTCRFQDMVSRCFTVSRYFCFFCFMFPSSSSVPGSHSRKWAGSDEIQILPVSCLWPWRKGSRHWFVLQRGPNISVSPSPTWMGDCLNNVLISANQPV